MPVLRCPVSPIQVHKLFRAVEEFLLNIKSDSQYEHTVILEIFAVVNNSRSKETAKIKHAKI